MRVDSGIPVVGGSFVAGTSAGAHNTAGPSWPRELMPFTIRIARSEGEIEKAVRVRHAAYSRHVPTFAERLKSAEEYDYDQGSIVLLAESKLDGSPLGTMRIQTNRYQRLALEGTVALPDWLQGRSLAEATRLGVSEGKMGRVVKAMLFKAYFFYCLATDVDWMVICARSPLDRQYDALLFQDVYPDQGFIPMDHIGGIAHRLMAFEMKTAYDRWLNAGHPLFNFFCRTIHPDIQLRRENPAFGNTAPRTESYGWAQAYA
jgi:hypothetical protein